MNSDENVMGRCPLQHPGKDSPRCSEGRVRVKYQDRTLEIKASICNW